MNKIYLPLTEEITRALMVLAQSEMRPMRDQIQFIIRNELIRRGLLLPENPIETLKECEERWRENLK